MLSQARAVVLSFCSWRLKIFRGMAVPCSLGTRRPLASLRVLLPDPIWNQQQLLVLEPNLCESLHPGLHRTKIPVHHSCLLALMMEVFVKSTMKAIRYPSTNFDGKSAPFLLGNIIKQQSRVRVPEEFSRGKPAFGV